MTQCWAMIAHNDGSLLKAYVSIWLLAACAPAGTAQLTNSAPKYIRQTQTPCISVLVINPARVPEDTLFVALDKARRIFLGTGVSLIWCGPQVSSRQQVGFTDSSPDSANTLVLRITSRPVTGLASPDALGFAVVAGEGSKYASVFRDRVLGATRRGRYSEAMLMGHAIAHELGHLLLGTSAHTRYGLMAARWRTNELNRAEVGLLQFSPDEAARLRTESLRRTMDKSSFGSQSGLPMMVRRSALLFLFPKLAPHLYRATSFRLRQPVTIRHGLPIMRGKPAFGM
jgi:hypothetical protein